MRLFIWLWDVIKGIFTNTANTTTTKREEEPVATIELTVAEEEFMEVSLTI